MTLEQYQAQQRAQSGVQTAGYETPVNPQAGAATGVATAGTAGASAPSKQMSVTDIALPRQFQLPEGTNPQPIATASQANRAGHMQRPASAAQYQQPFYQQPAAAMQPVMQAVQPPVVNGAAVMQQIPPTGGQWQQPNAIGQRPVTMTPINAPGIYVPQNQPMAAPINVPQYVGTQPIMPQAAQSMPPQYQGGMMPQQQAAAIPTQQMTTMPAQQMVPQPAYPQQGYQQAPATNGVRTAVSYGPPPATIPWR
jgi:hypothetical protein